jgi:hypothetical protein
MSKFDLNFLREKPLYIFLLFAAWFILITPLADAKIIPGHDCVFHVTRFLNIAEAIKNGVFPVRMYADDVRFWGAPVGIFYPSLFFYIPALLKLAGLPVEICFNIFIALVFLLGTFASWYGFTLLTKSKNIAFFSALLYISSGYYLMDAYIRSAIGELLGLSFMPLAIASIDILAAKSKVKVKDYVWGILAVSAVIQSHVLCSVALVIFGIFCLAVHYKNISLRQLRRIFGVITVVFLLNAHFIIPFLLFYKVIPVTMDFVDGFAEQGWPTVVLFRFFLAWNFWLLVAVYFYLPKMLRSLNSKPVEVSGKSQIKIKKEFLLSKMYIYYFLAGCLFLFMADLSFPWDMFPRLTRFFQTMQFPWRFLGVSTLCFCVPGGICLHTFLSGKKRKINGYLVLSVFLVCLTSLTAFIKLAPISSIPDWNMPAMKFVWKRINSVSDTDYLYNDIDRQKLLEQGNRYISDGVISNYSKNGTSISFSYSVSNKKKTRIILPLVNFPGYIAVDNTGREVDIEESGNHMIQLSLPEGSGNIKIWYKGLPLFAVADYISLFSTLGFMILVYSVHKNKRWNRLLG